MPEITTYSDIAGSSRRTIITSAMTLQKFDSAKDYYRVLGVAENATADDLDRAYRGALADAMLAID